MLANTGYLAEPYPPSGLRLFDHTLPLLTAAIGVFVIVCALDSEYRYVRRIGWKSYVRSWSDLLRVDVDPVDRSDTDRGPRFLPSRWIQLSTKPDRRHWRSPDKPLPTRQKAPNLVTGTAVPRRGLLDPLQAMRNGDESSSTVRGDT